MYIEPQTNIKLLSGIPLDSSYGHTIYFSSAAKQREYFNGKVKHNLTSQTYQRVKRGYARVGKSADDCYDCNYIMFQNTAYGSKWFYGFITSVEYVNNTCCEITFVIDVIQTWLFEANVDMAYVDRCHAKNDYIGDNLAPEPVPVGNMVMNQYNEVVAMSAMSFLVAVINLNDEVTGYVYDKIYSGAHIYVAHTATEVNIIINGYAQQPDNIVGIYMCPTFILPTNRQESSGWLNTNTNAIVVHKSYSALSTSTTLDGYKPHNCKLYTYPYTFFHVDNGGGQELSLRYEYFKNGTPQFSIHGCILQPVQINLYPYEYRVAGQPATTNKDYVYNAEALQISNFPMCSWRIDSYQAWVAQNALPLTAGTAVSGLGGAISGMANMASTAVLAGNPVTGGAIAGAAAIGALSGALPTVLSGLSQGYQASIAADQCKGNLSNGSATVSAGYQKFYGGMCSVDRHSARIIDEFFDVYGYSQKRLMKVNRNARPHWTYVKTAGITITGKVPPDDIAKLQRIYDNGLTWWNDGSEVGNYALSNLATNRGVK